MGARDDPVVSGDPDVMHGELVFTGTRVRLKTLVDYKKAGHTLDVFLDGLPTVHREAANLARSAPILSSSGAEPAAS